MLKKEWIDVSAQTLFVAAFIVLLPLFLIWTGVTPEVVYADVFFPLLQFGLFFLAFLLGASFLATERYQRGLVYVLTLPFSRLRLLFLKIIPRISALLIFLGIYFLLFQLWGANRAAISHVSFILIFVSLFIISLSLSASAENLLVLFFGSLFGLLFFLGLGFLVIWAALRLKGYVFYELYISEFFTGEFDAWEIGLFVWLAVFILLPLVFSFVSAFRKLDARPVRVLNVRLLKRLGILLLVGICVALLFSYQRIDIGDRKLYLSKDHKVLESRWYSRSKIYDGQTVHKLERPDLWYFSVEFEVDGKWIVSMWDGFLAIDTNDYSEEVLYRCQPGRDIYWWEYHYENQLLFITHTRHYTEKRLEILDLSTKAVQSIRLDQEPLSMFSNQRIFGTDTYEGRRFWLISMWNTDRGRQGFRIWEDGSVEPLGEKLGSLVYVNGLLLTYADNEMIFHRQEEGDFVPFQRVPNPENFGVSRAYSTRRDLNNVPLEALFVQRIVRDAQGERTLQGAFLDLKDFQINKLEEPINWASYVGNGHYYYFQEPEEDSPGLKVFRFIRGELDLLREFPDMSYEAWHNDTSFKFSPGGMILIRKKKVRVFVFPDLEEIKFKKLN
jgi:hypothetical protein